MKKIIKNVNKFSFFPWLNYQLFFYCYLALVHKRLVCVHVVLYVPLLPVHVRLVCVLMCVSYLYTYAWCAYCVRLSPVHVWLVCVLHVVLYMSQLMMNCLQVEEIHLSAHSYSEKSVGNNAIPSFALNRR